MELFVDSTPNGTTIKDLRFVFRFFLLRPEESLVPRGIETKATGFLQLPTFQQALSRVQAGNKRSCYLAKDKKKRQSSIPDKQKPRRWSFDTCAPSNPQRGQDKTKREWRQRPSQNSKGPSWAFRHSAFPRETNKGGKVRSGHRYSQNQHCAK